MSDDKTLIGGGNDQVRAPEQYTDFTVPEGSEFKLEGDALTEFHTFAKGLDLSQESAQKLYENYASRDSGSKEELPSAPEKYEEFKAPEVLKDFKLEGDALMDFQGFAKEMNLTQDGAQKLYEKLATHDTETQQKVVQSMQSEFTKIQEKWKSDLAADSEFGGSNQNETVTRAQRVLTEFFPKELNQLLDEGYGNNNHLIIGLAKIDKALGERKAPQSGAAGGKGDKPIWSGFYGNSPDLK